MLMHFVVKRSDFLPISDKPISQLSIAVGKARRREKKASDQKKKNGAHAFIQLQTADKAYAATIIRKSIFP